MGYFMDGFKKLPKMQTGGRVKKMADGGSSDSSSKYDTSKFMEVAGRIQRGEAPPPAPEGSKMRAAQDEWKEIKAKSDERLARFDERQSARAAAKGGSGGGGGGADLPKGMTPGGPKNRNYKTGGPVGLYANIAAKRRRIAEGSGEKMRKPGDPGAPTKQAFIESAKTAKK
jgi:hypothetical protein